MRFGKFRLQLKRAVGQRTRFLPSLDRAFVVMQDPTFQLRVARHGKGEARVELDSALEELLALFKFSKIPKKAGKFGALNKTKETLPIFSWLGRHRRFSLGDKFCPQ